MCSSAHGDDARLLQSFGPEHAPSHCVRCVCRSTDCVRYALTTPQHAASGSSGGCHWSRASCCASGMARRHHCACWRSRVSVLPARSDRRAHHTYRQIASSALIWTFTAGRSATKPCMLRSGTVGEDTGRGACLLEHPEACKLATHARYACCAPCEGV